MLFAVICLDRPGSAPSREAALADHRRHVDQHALWIVSSGPLLEDDGTTRCGQLFVVDVGDRHQVTTLIDTDPFVTAGVFESVIVRRFSPVFTDGARRVS